MTVKSTKKKRGKLISGYRSKKQEVREIFSMSGKIFHMANKKLTARFIGINVSG